MRAYQPALLLALLCGVASAQDAAIVGTVTDQTNASVVGAEVTVRETGTGFARSTKTSAEGYFSLPSLRASEYTLEVGAPGFRTFKRTGIGLQVSQSLTVNVPLELGATADTVTVDVAPNQVDTTTSTIKQVVDQERMVELPLNGRNPAQLSLLVAGAVSAPSGGADQGQTKTFPGAVTISSSGARGNQINYLLDGGSNTDVFTNVNLPFPFPDALQEFSVQTSNFSAEYGQNAGGVVQVVTKSGTNQYHGNAFNFLRNAVFNARNAFASTRDGLKRNQYGGTLGGPIVIPKLYNGRDKTFFFFGYQGTKSRNMREGLSAYVPTAANLTGDFSNMLSASDPANPLGRAITVRDPATNLPFAGNQIPTAMLDRAALGVIPYLPTSTRPNGQVIYSTPVIQSFDSLVTRIDHSISAMDRLTFRWADNTFDSDPIYRQGNILTYATGANIVARNFLLQETHVFTPSLLNDIRFTYLREVATRNPPPGIPNVRDFGVQNIFQPDEKSISLVNVNGFFRFGDFPRAKFVRNNFILANDLRWTAGKHNVSIGAYIERARVDITNQFRQPGEFTFTGDRSGFAVSDFVLGSIRNLRQGYGEYFNGRNTFMGFYIQDNYRASRRLTLNLGLRWEPSLPWRELGNRIAQFDTTRYAAGETSQVYVNAPAGLFFVGDKGVPKNGMTPDLNNFSPRAGFAYDLFGDGKTSLRGGAGVFLDSREVGTSTLEYANTTPFSPQVNLTNPTGPFSDPLRGYVNPFPAPFPPPKDSLFPLPMTAMGYDPDRKLITATLYNWNMAIERQLTGNWLARAAYVGSRGIDLRLPEQINPAVYIPGSSLGPDARRLYQGYTTIMRDSRVGTSSYHSLQLTTQRRMAKGLDFLANYTWSKSIDNIHPTASLIGLGGSAGTTLPWYVPNARAMERGPSAWDRKHRFVSSVVWQAPSISKQMPWIVRTLGDWQLSGILTLQSGAPLTITAGTDRSQTALGQDRAVPVGQSYGSGACAGRINCVDYLNPASFALPAIGSAGTIGKGALRGPGGVYLDAGLFKNFAFTERVVLQFRAEFFNALNRVNLAAPISSMAASGFGGITSAEDPRIGQLALKLKF